MDTEQNDDLNVLDQPANVGEAQEGATDVVATSAATSVSRIHDLPCHCWKTRIPKDKRIAQAPVALSLILPQVRAELERAIQAFNSLVTLVEKQADEIQDPAASLPSDIRDTFCLRRETIAAGFDAAIVVIRTTPGYVCKQGSAEHDRRYSARHKALTNIEDDIARSLKDAEPLFKAREELLLAERRHRRRKDIQTAVRALSIVTIPYSPTVSALFTAADLFGISVVIAIQRAVFPDADDQLGETLDRVVSLVRDLERKVGEVKRLKENLEAVKTKLQAERMHPIATQLADILDMVYRAQLAVEDVLFPSCDKCTCSHPVVPIREVVSSLQVMAEALECQEMVDGPLASLCDEQCAVVDRVFSVLRTLPRPIAQTGSH
ncbi:hypothetical protein OH76DRAFT_1411191 [Lentinus brumalis]|uniref:Uncharacterized protein n=1 Tax=Lentinus brumalis TaxID=2498619 RepID=A0A371CQ50_9APHY|nr:hypothetical protein OH76DRAFT_1411191 [Polyporus brumalis]